MSSNALAENEGIIQIPSYSDLQDTESPFSSLQLSLLSIFNNATVGLSLLALFAFYISIAASRTNLSFSARLVCNLFFADLIYTFSNLLANFSEDQNFICQVEGFMRTFSLWSSVIWVNIIGFTALYSARNNSSVQKKYRMFLLIAYGWPCVISILPLFPDLPFYYGSNDIYCWIQSDTSTVLMKWILFFGWIWVIILITTVVYIRLYLYLRSLNINTEVFEYRVLLIYPILLYITLIPATVDNTGVLDDHPFIMMALHIFSLHSIGFFNVLAYGIQKIKEMARLRRSMAQEMLTSGFEQSEMRKSSRPSRPSRMREVWESVEESGSASSKTSQISSQQSESLKIVLSESVP